MLFLDKSKLGSEANDPTLKKIETTLTDLVDSEKRADILENKPSASQEVDDLRANLNADLTATMATPSETLGVAVKEEIPQIDQKLTGKELEALNLEILLDHNTENILTKTAELQEAEFDYNQSLKEQ